MRRLAVLLLLASCAGPRPDEALRLKIMSYNIRIGMGGGPRRTEKFNLEPVADIIRRHAPDIAGLQEVDRKRKRSLRMDQPKWLCERLKMDVAYHAAIEEGEEQYGIAILSRHPIAAHARRLLFRPDYSKSHPDYPGYFSEQRILIHAEVRAGGRAIHFFNTHLGLTSDQREKQIAEIAAITQGFAGPKIIVGDFNAGPADPEMKPMYDLYVDALAGAADRRSFPAGARPKEAIDHIFVSREFRVLSGRVILDETLASDHNPVVAEVELAK